MRHEVLPSSVEGVRQLAGLGDVAYYAAFDLLVAGGHPKLETKVQEKMVEVLRQRLVVVAFGVEKRPLPSRASGLRVLTLPSWRKVSGLAASLDLLVESSL